MKHLLVLTALVLLLPAAASAHGVEILDETGRPDVHTVRFMYTDGESMLFARVKVFSPSSPGAAVQESIADRYGYFSFIPFESGQWRISGEDGMGHRGEIFVTAEASAEAAGTAAGTGQNAAGLPAKPAALPAAITLGLSLILNVFAAWYLLGKKLKKTGAGRAH
jgi:hypothetical protein